jgi:hypothetical protein
MKFLPTFATALVLSLAGPAAAQDPDAFNRYYANPRPDRLVGFLDRFQHGKDWGAFPPVAGFFAVIFRRHPEWIDRLIPATPNAQTSETMVAAFWLAGRSDVPGTVKPRLSSAGSDPMLKSQFANQPQALEAINIATPTHLDILWGASFASGDGRYTRMVADYFARTADRSEAIAADVCLLTTGIFRRDQNVVAEVAERYPDPATRRDLLFAATAAWGLRSNAGQHPFIGNAMNKWIADHPNSHAAKCLATLR